MKEDYYWTDPAIPFTDLDALEVWGVIDTGEACEPCTEASQTPAFWSVYGHMDGVGLMCYADRNTRREALLLALTWGDSFSLPVEDHTYG